MRRPHAVGAALLLALAAGCARFEIYNNEALAGSESGVRFYTPKPYVLVAHTDAKDKPVEISIVFLPDLEKPQYAKPTSGLGSASLTLKLTNGMLTEFGQVTDTKIPDLITAVSGLAKNLADARKVAEGAASAPRFELYEIVQSGGRTTLKKATPPDASQLR